jgi:hypothetical protein
VVAPRSQRFRSPYFAGAPVGSLSANASTFSTSVPAPPAFRTEYRFRLAGVFPVDENYQESFDGTANTGDSPESMVYVPMDQSGLDRDFFIYRWIASLNSGSYQAFGSFNLHPNTSVYPTSTTWTSTLGQCFDTRLRTGTQSCGSSAVPNGTMQSAVHVVPGTLNNFNASSSASHADYFNGCGGSFLWGNNNPGSGYRYSLRMATTPEWNVASDWGDTLKDGTIAINPNASNVGATVSSVEAQYCANFNAYEHGNADMDSNDFPYTGGFGAHTSPANSPQRRCVSRFGGNDWVGVMAQLSDAYFGDGAGGAIGLDNGVDGMVMGTPLEQGTNVVGAVDLWRGFQWGPGPTSSIGAASSIATNSNAIENDFSNWATHYSTPYSPPSQVPGNGTWAPALGCGLVYNGTPGTPACGRLTVELNPDMFVSDLSYNYSTRCAYGF